MIELDARLELVGKTGRCEGGLPSLLIGQPSQSLH